MDTAVENAIILHSTNGQQHRFTPSGKGLYKWEDMMDPTADNPCWLFVTTVCGHGHHYTQRAYEHAQAERCLQNIIMCPASRHMSDIAISHLCNYPHHKRRCPGSRRHFWDEPWEPDGKDSLVSKQTCPGWDFSCSPIHSQHSSGRGSFIGHHV